MACSFSSACFLVAAVIQGRAVDVLLHGAFDFLHHLQRCCLASGLKCLLHVGLAQGFAEIVVDILDAALPARLQFLRAAAASCRRNAKFSSTKADERMGALACARCQRR